MADTQSAFLTVKYKIHNKFTRELNTDYRDLIDGMPPEILGLYDVGVAGDRAALTFDVLNVRFVASAD